MKLTRYLIIFCLTVLLVSCSPVVFAESFNTSLLIGYPSNSMNVNTSNIIGHSSNGTYDNFVGSKLDYWQNLNQAFGLIFLAVFLLTIIKKDMIFKQIFLVFWLFIGVDIIYCGYGGILDAGILLMFSLYNLQDIVKLKNDSKGDRK